MKHRQRGTVAAILALVLAGVTWPALVGAAEQEGTLGLSPELSELLREEMGELSKGVRAIALALATADWEVLEAASGKMHESYIMKKSLTPALAAELERKLPPGFKRMDAAFHARALKLRNAAERRDSELSAFHFSRLIESCAGCHGEYAAGRFPGFSEGPQQPDGH